MTELSSSVVSDSMGRTGAMQGRIRCLTGLSVQGPAFTVRVAPGENATLHRAVYEAPAGSVLVVDGGGDPDRALWGEVLTAAAQREGVAGLVVDGAVRDVDAMRARRFPVFAVGSCPAGPFKEPQGQLGEPVTCGGIPVHSGDLVLGDPDGVAVVPAADVDRVLADARTRAQTEQEWIEAIGDGVSTLELLGLQNQRR